MDSGAQTANEISKAPVLPAAPSRPARSELALRLRAGSEYVAIPALALVIAAFLFSIFLIAIGKSPVDFVDNIWRGGFGSAFSFQNTLQRSAPLILTALAVAIPARIGLIMIGGEGALVLGGFSSAAIAVPMIGVAPPWFTLLVMAVVGVAAGAAWVIAVHAGVWPVALVVVGAAACALFAAGGASLVLVGMAQRRSR